MFILYFDFFLKKSCSFFVKRKYIFSSTTDYKQVFVRACRPILVRSSDRCTSVDAPIICYYFQILREKFTLSLNGIGYVYAYGTGVTLPLDIMLAIVATRSFSEWHRFHLPGQSNSLTCRLRFFYYQKIYYGINCFEYV